MKITDRIDRAIAEFTEQYGREPSIFFLGEEDMGLNAD